MQVGLFFGTFNPIHIGHLILANHIQQNSDLEEVWFIVTPRSPFKKNQTLAQDYERLHMVNLAIEDYDYLRASNIEFDLPQPNYTVYTLAVLHEKYPQHQFALIMGEDNLQGLHKWKNASHILQHYTIFVYPRITHEKNEADSRNLTMVQTEGKIQRIKAPIVEISSTQIRQDISKRLNIRPLLPHRVYEYIIGSNMYQ